MIKVISYCEEHTFFAKQADNTDHINTRHLLQSYR